MRHYWIMHFLYNFIISNSHLAIFRPDINLKIEQKMIEEGGAAFFYDVLNGLRRTEYHREGKEYPFMTIEEKQVEIS